MVKTLPSRYRGHGFNPWWEQFHMLQDTANESSRKRERCRVKKLLHPDCSDGLHNCIMITDIHQTMHLNGKFLLQENNTSKTAEK